MTIFKYEIPVQDEFHLELPGGVRILSVGVQHGTPKIWALVSPDVPTRTAKFALFGTGHEVPLDIALNYEFVGTFQLLEGSLVFHLFVHLDKAGT